jgi:hypothetical protein
MPESPFSKARETQQHSNATHLQLEVLILEASTIDGFSAGSIATLKRTRIFASKNRSERHAQNRTVKSPP